MFSIIFSALSAYVCFFFSKKNPSQRVWAVGFCVFVNWFLVEIVVYVYLVYLVSCGNYLFLIGHQKFLDGLIKKDINERLYANQNSHNSFYQIDPYLGYTVGKNKNYWVYRSNGQGIRADKEYPLEPSPQKLRLAVFGDSFVFCDGEPNEATWPNILEQSHEGLEVINFGVSGYGLSSSYLRYLKEGQAYKPDVVFINYVEIANRDWYEGGLIGGAEMRRSTLYRPLLSLKDGKLQVKQFKPLDFFEASLRDEYLYQPLKLKGSLWFWNLPIFSMTNTGLAFKNLYLQNKLNQALVKQELDPQVKAQRLAYSQAVLYDLLQTAQNNNSWVVFFSEQEFKDLPPVIQATIGRFQGRVIFVGSKSLLYAFFEKLNLHPKDYLNGTNHYNVTGNRIYAAAVSMVLKNNRWIGAPKRTFEFCPKTNRFQNLSIEPCS